MDSEYKRKSSNIRLLVLVIFILAILAGSLDYPVLWDKTVDFLNNKTSFGLPHFYKLPFHLGLDLQGGTHLIYQADLSQIEEKEKGGSLEGIRDVIERRVNLFGVTEPLVQINKTGESYRLIVELPGIKDIGGAIKMIGETPYLEFKEEDGEDFKNTALTGRYLKKAQLEFDQTTYQPYVGLEFNDEGAKLFGEITTKNVGKRVAIYLDGVPISIPVVREAITGGRAQITGDFTVEEAKTLVQRLNAGALPVPITLIGQQTVGASLGHESLIESLKAGIIGFLAILLFMIIFYRLSGFFAAVSLVIYVIVLLAIFKLIPVTLTLAGIAGFLLSMGMAVDANILIFSRTKEELKAGRNYLDSLNNGIKRAWPSIRDGNFTTILVGLILFIFGTSFVKGFALTLIIGNVVNLFSAIVITNYLIKFFLRRTEGTKRIWL